MSFFCFASSSLAFTSTSGVGLEDVGGGTSSVLVGEDAFDSVLSHLAEESVRIRFCRYEDDGILEPPTRSETGSIVRVAEVLMFVDKGAEPEQ